MAVGVRGYILGRKSGLIETSKSPVLHMAGWKERSEKSQMEKEAFNNGPSVALGGHPETLTETLRVSSFHPSFMDSKHINIGPIHVVYWQPWE